MLEYLNVPLHVDDALDSLDDHLNRKIIPPLRGNGNIGGQIVFKCPLKIIIKMVNSLFNAGFEELDN